MLKNYTSQVSSQRSINFIETKLVQHGAKQIVKQFTVDGRVSGILFSLPIDGHEVPIRVPAKVSECERILLENLSPRAKQSTRKKIPAQAERTAWKIASDWVESQMAMVELAQVEIMEVFLSYVYDPAKEITYFEALKKTGFKHVFLGSAFKALPAPKKGQ